LPQQKNSGRINLSR